jgi:dipeptidyl aminopeptidase/acylaminoacyl peptidase
LYEGRRPLLHTGRVTTKCILLSATLAMGFLAQIAIAKLPVTASAFEKWPQAESSALSPDGHYVVFDASGLGENCVVQATDGTWIKQLPRARPPAGDISPFSADSKRLVVMTLDNVVHVISLRSASEITVTGVASYKLPPDASLQWIAYLAKDVSQELVIRNLRSGQEERIASVEDYSFSPSGKALVVKQHTDKAGAANSLLWVDLAHRAAIRHIWEGQALDSVVFDPSGTYVAFVGRGDSTPDSQALLLYRDGDDRAISRVDAHTAGVPEGEQVGHEVRFSRFGHKVYFVLIEARGQQANPAAAKVDIWNYRDAQLQSHQLKHLERAVYRAVVTVDGAAHVVQIARDGDQLLENDYSDNEHWVAVVENRGADEMWRGASGRPALYAVSTDDGERRKVAEHIDGFAYPSPNGRYIVYADSDTKRFLSYDTVSGATRDISAGINQSLFDDKGDYPGPVMPWVRPLEAREWVPGTTSLILADRFDLWRVDASGKVPPVNLTNGYGRKHGIVLRIARMQHRFSSPLVAPLLGNTLVLSAFDPATKDNGFFRLAERLGSDPVPLTMGPYHYQREGGMGLGTDGWGTSGAPVVRAQQADVFVVRRMDAAHSPNLFLSRDLEHFTALTSVYPEAAYNWLSDELVTFKVPGRGNAQGILYRPEDFDPSRIYPVIFYFYERLSQELHEYKRPDWSDGVLNIATEVSRGYLVFVPDIYHTMGKACESASRYITAAADKLATFPWVDQARMGLSGHSFGGYDVNCVVTRTSRFAAAVSASGVSDLISFDGVPDGGSGNDSHEFHQHRLDESLWQDLPTYIDNSPVLAADRISTPLLLMSNRGDDTVPWTQGLEMFTALRRLGKPTWLLQYDGEGHQVGGVAAQDFSIRMDQFFDHYLRGAPVPKWMTEGVPARLKGVDMGLELDSGAKPH